MTSTKSNIRRHFIQIRNNLPLSQQITLSQKIASTLVETPFWRNSKTVMLYLSTGSEVFTLALVTLSILEGKTTLLPKVSNKDILPIRVGKNFKIVSGFRGILEPESNDVFEGGIDLVIVPLVAFDEKGYRIGYGGGFYDRFLRKNKAKLKVGLAYEIQKIEKLPSDNLDEKLDVVITEKGIYHF